jgi:hypothetical protein
MKANVALALREGTNEDPASQNGKVLLLLNQQGKILCKLPLGSGHYNYTLELNDINSLTDALWEFERSNPWFHVVKVRAIA